MKDWLVPIVVALIGGALSGGAVPLVQALRGRGRARADAADVLSDTAREWVEEFKSETQAARAEAREARAELARVRQETTSEMDRIRLEAKAIANELHALHQAILAPAATIDGLRDLVRRGSGPAVNGRTT